MAETLSILSSMKLMLGMEPDYTPFDTDIIININACLAKLTQIGVGPDEGFEITDATQTWEDFMGSDPRLNLTKTWMYTQLRLMFDPPQNSFVVESLKEQEMEYYVRLSYYVDPDGQLD